MLSNLLFGWSIINSSDFRRKYLLNLHNEELPMKEAYADFQKWLNGQYPIKNRFPLCKKYPGIYLLSVE